MKHKSFPSWAYHIHTAWVVNIFLYLEYFYTWKYKKLWLKVEITNSNARKHSTIVAEAKSLDLEVDMLSVF